jgi:hypothetical protein
MHHLLMNKDRGWGITMEREAENSGRTSSQPSIHPCH